MMIRQAQKQRPRWKEPRYRRGGVNQALAKKMVRAARLEGKKGVGTLEKFLTSPRAYVEHTPGARCHSNMLNYIANTFYLTYSAARVFQRAGLKTRDAKETTNPRVDLPRSLKR